MYIPSTTCVPWVEQHGVCAIDLAAADSLALRLSEEAFLAATTVSWVKKNRVVSLADAGDIARANVGLAERVLCRGAPSANKKKQE